MPEPALADQKRVAILISGRGSNMRALIEHAAGYEVVLVASNRPEALGLDYAHARQISTWSRDSKSVRREQFEAELSQVLRDHCVGTIALAGFMRLLSPKFVAEWQGRIVNIHPSLLPKYPGLDTHARALAAGDNVSGCSVHIVTDEVDAGEVIARAEVPVEPGDDVQSLQQRVLAAEHILYPRALKEFVIR
jgi:phosphoribosylglycinamide formyltransferase-1